MVNSSRDSGQVGADAGRSPHSSSPNDEEPANVSLLLNTVLAAAAGLIIATGQPPSSYPVLGFVGGVAWLAAAYRSTPVLAAVNSAVCGFVVGLSTAAWIPSALSTFGVDSLDGSTFLVAISLVITLPPFLAVGLLARLARQFSPPLASLVVAVAVFSVETLAGSVRSLVPWSQHGYALYGVHGLTQVAVIGGVPMVSAMLCAVSASWARLITCQRTRATWATALALSASVLVMLVLGMDLMGWVRSPPNQSHTEPLRLMLVQPNLERADRWLPHQQPSNLRSLVSLTKQALRQAPESRPPDLIVWPELAVTNPIDFDDELREELTRSVAEFGKPLVVGLVRSAESGERNRYRNSVGMLRPMGNGAVRTQWFDKTLAVPFVESASSSWLSAFFQPYLGEMAAWPRVEEGSAEAPIAGPPALAVVLCYEALFPRIAAERAWPETVALLNLADDSWVSASVPSERITAYASFRSIELRKPFIRVAHGGVSAVYDELGRETLRLPRDREAVAIAELKRADPVSWQERLSILSLWAVPALVVYQLVMRMPRPNFDPMG